MARRGHTRPVQIQELSESERIPVKFLEQILLVLKNSNLLRSKRGAGGGYQLNRTADQIALGEIIELIDGPFIPVTCCEEAKPGHCGCGQSGPCGLGSTFLQLQSHVSTFLREKTLADVLTSESQSTPSFDI